MAFPLKRDNMKVLGDFLLHIWIHAGIAFKKSLLFNDFSCVSPSKTETRTLRSNVTPRRKFSPGVGPKISQMSQKKFVVAVQSISHLCLVVKHIFYRILFQFDMLFLPVCFLQMYTWFLLGWHDHSKTIHCWLTKFNCSYFFKRITERD